MQLKSNPQSATACAIASGPQFPEAAGDVVVKPKITNIARKVEHHRFDMIFSRTLEKNELEYANSQLPRKILSTVTRPQSWRMQTSIDVW